MAHWRNYAHVVEVSFSDYVLRYIQTILALALLVLTAYTISFNDYASVRLSVFAVSAIFLCCTFSGLAAHNVFNHQC